MLLPTLSVSTIGLLVGLVTRPSPWTTRSRHVLGSLAVAWLGFVAGAVFGVLLDVVLTTDHWLAVLGHVGAVISSVGMTGSTWVAGRRSVLGEPSRDLPPRW